MLSARTRETSKYNFRGLLENVSKELIRFGFEVTTNVKEEKIVQKAFVRMAGLPRALNINFPANQKLEIKIEVDVRPPRHGIEETYFVTRWGELFPVVKFDIPTLFSGKVLAILLRPYTRGRDYYDLIWFLSQKATPNIPYLQSGLKQSKTSMLDLSSWEDVLEELKKKVNVVSPARLLKDLRPFIEDASEFNWIERYKDVFQQLTNT